MQSKTSLHFALHATPSCIAELIEAGFPESKQPYHAVEFLCVEAAAGRLRGYLEVATAMAYGAIETQCAAVAERGYQVTSAGILESAGRKPSSLS